MCNSAPEPTPPKETSAAATGTNVATSVANAFLGNVSQNTPDGSLSYDVTGNHNWTDPYTGESYSIPTFTSTQTLSPEAQAVKDQENRTQLNLSTLAADQSGFLNDYMAEPFQYGVGEYEQWAGDTYGRLNDDKNAQSEEALRARLANQGIKVGTPLYERALGELRESQMGARDQFMLDAYGTGMQTALTERNQPINEITGLMSGSQVSQPNFINANMPKMSTTDNAAIISNTDQQKMNAWQQNQAAMGSMISGIGGLFTLSDPDAKTDKKKIAETDEGLGLYSFKYKGSPQTQIGLMADEVKKKKPKAVATGPDGLMRVDYGKALS